jgi:hypothetical protein
MTRVPCLLFPQQTKISLSAQYTEKPCLPSVPRPNLPTMPWILQVYQIFLEFQETLTLPCGKGRNVAGPTMHRDSLSPTKNNFPNLLLIPHLIPRTMHNVTQNAAGGRPHPHTCHSGYRSLGRTDPGLWSGLVPFESSEVAAPALPESVSLGPAPPVRSSVMLQTLLTAPP